MVEPELGDQREAAYLILPGERQREDAAAFGIFSLVAVYLQVVFVGEIFAAEGQTNAFGRIEIEVERGTVPIGINTIFIHAVRSVVAEAEFGVS